MTTLGVLGIKKQTARNSKETVKALFMEHYDRMYLLARIKLHDDEDYPTARIMRAYI